MNTSLILSIISLIIALASAVGFISFTKRFKSLVKSKTGETLEKTLEEMLKNLEIEKNQAAEIQKTLATHNGRLLKSVSKVGVVRYNPFENTGGDFSFSIAMLDEMKNGLILSSIHGREGTRIYAKPITDGKSKYNLSAEEEKAIFEALTPDEVKS